MAENNGLRKRKKKVEESGSIKKAPADGDDLDLDSVFNVKLLLFPILLVFGVVLYLNPAMVMDLLNSWAGFDGQPGSENFVSSTADLGKRNAVVTAFKHAWRAYERDAMGSDEYHPIAHKGTNLTDAGGIGYTVIDSIDTMLIMGLEDDYKRARSWVKNKLDFDKDGIFNTFETTIRVLGGLLSAYHLSSNDPLYLKKAVDLADRMLPVFDTPSGLPFAQINLAKRKGVKNTDFPDLVSAAEVATLQLELRYLSHLTGNEIYWEKAEHVMKLIKNGRQPHGLASIYLSSETGKFVPSAIRLGSRADSYYEYLLKQYIQTNRTELVYREMYDDAMNAIHEHLIHKSLIHHMVYTAELIPERHPDGELSWRRTPKQDHLVCFFGGSLMLGATVTGSYVDRVSIPPNKKELSISGNRDWKSGVELVRTCMATHDTATGLAPEIAHFRIESDNIEQLRADERKTPQDWYIKGALPGSPPPYDARYILRPETVESLFIAYRLTGSPLYRDRGWEIFKAIEKHCRVETGGYASVLNVDEIPVQQEDKMETFLLSETLKYLYLLFDDHSVLPLDEYVFNTEAHPLPIFNPTISTGFS
ncbi:glycoside hydrolase [Mycena floridula]|nr:glycoside hydrolase [Mycena floridula]